MQVAHGKTLYKDVWFDKPPLVAWVYVLWGARAGAWLRLAGAGYVLAVAGFAWQFARTKWSEKEGLAAAMFAAFFLTFGVASAVIPLASDMLLILPHILAIYFAWRGRAFWSGAAAGIGLLCSSKAMFVLAACLLWQWRSAPLSIGWIPRSQRTRFRLDVAERVGGRILPSGVAVGIDLCLQHIFRPSSIHGSKALKRTAGWMGFQAALVLGAAVALTRDRRWRLAAWIAISLVGVVLGLRVFPRYYFLLFPPMHHRRGTRLAARESSGFGSRCWLCS